MYAAGLCGIQIGQSNFFIFSSCCSSSCPSLAAPSNTSVDGLDLTRQCLLSLNILVFIYVSVLTASSDGYQSRDKNAAVTACCELWGCNYAAFFVLGDLASAYMRSLASPPFPSRQHTPPELVVEVTKPKIQILPLVPPSQIVVLQGAPFTWTFDAVSRRQLELEREQNLTQPTSAYLCLWRAICQPRLTRRLQW